ncbi:MAG: substrate-binding domain-containing protein [Spirochaetales bacterium]|nr:substrate-binding domain-containing protein [Spirochaetales bacterium]
MKKRKLYIVLIIFIVLIVFFGTVKVLSERAEKPYNITFIRMKEGGQFWSSMRNGVREARTDNHCIVDFYSTVNAADVSTQIDYINKTVNNGTDCIVITPCSYYLLQKPLKIAEESGVKVISLFNEYDKDEESSASFYMTDLHPAGRAMAEELFSNNKFSYINALIVGSFATLSSERYLAEGFSEVLKNEPNANFKVIYTGRKIDSICTQIINSYKIDSKINIIFTVNAETSEALIKALQMIDSGNNILSVVSSNSLINIESLETNIVDYILVINSFAMGYQSIYAAIDLIEGKKVENISVDFSIVNKKNMFEPDIQKRLFLMP